MEGIWHKHTRRYATNRKSISEIFPKYNGKTLDWACKKAYTFLGDRQIIFLDHVHGIWHAALFVDVCLN